MRTNVKHQFVPFRRANEVAGAFHGNLPWWPSGARSRSTSRVEGVSGNSPVPPRTSGTVRHPSVVTAAARVLPKPRRVPKNELTTRFRTLVERWREDTQFHSSIGSLFMHPDYQEIIGLGRDALPLILDDLATTRSDWFWALRAISGENPVPPEERGQIEKMTERWLEWGHAHDYL